MDKVKLLCYKFVIRGWFLKCVGGVVDRVINDRLGKCITVFVGG